MFISAFYRFKSSTYGHLFSRATNEVRLICLHTKKSLQIKRVLSVWSNLNISVTFRLFTFFQKKQLFLHQSWFQHVVVHIVFANEIKVIYFINFLDAKFRSLIFLYLPIAVGRAVVGTRIDESRVEAMAQRAMPIRRPNIVIGKNRLK